MLLIIYESGEAWTQSALSNDDIRAFEDGLIDVFDVGGKPIKRLTTGMTWEDVDTSEDD